MGASSSAEPPPDRRYGGAPAPGERVRRVRVAGAGVPEVNGVYVPCEDVFGGEAFQLQVNANGMTKIYIRRRSNGMRYCWVISTSLTMEVCSGHLYTRECNDEEHITPPLFGWTPCTTRDGVPGHRAAQLGQGVPKLKYHYGPLEDINWDCLPPSREQLDRLTNARGARSGQQGVSSSLVVCVIGANNIPETRAREFHVACQVPGKNEIIESVPVRACPNPEFKLKSPLQSWEHPDPLRITLYADRNIKIGAAELDYEYFQEVGFCGQVPVTLFGSESQEGTMTVCVTMPGQATPGFDIQIRKEHGSKIGIEIAPDSLTNSLSVIQILEGGLIAQWNYDNPDFRVLTRDKITEIDGESGSCRAMLAKFALDVPRTIHMRIQRAGT